MRREKKRVIISFALTACMVFTTEFGSLAADTQSDAQPRNDNFTISGDME